MSARTKDGYVAVYVRDGSSYAVRADQFEAVRDIWRSGVAFLATVGIHDQPLIIKCAEIQGMSFLSAETLAAVDEDNRLVAQETKAQQMIDGES